MAAAFVVSAHAQDAPDERWYVISDAGGARLGHASRRVVSGAEGREVVASQRLYLTDEGGSATVVDTRTVYRQDVSGAMQSIEVETISGRARTRTVASIDGPVAFIVRETAAGRHTAEVALPSDVRFDNGSGLFPDWDPVAAPRLTFDNFDIDAMGVERVVIEARRSADAGTVAVRRRYEGDQLIGLARLLIDASGRAVETTQPMFATTVRIVEADRETARRAHRPYSVMPNMMIRSPFRISNLAAQRHIRYRFGFTEDMEFLPPQTGEQRIAATPGFVTIDICDGCGPGLSSQTSSLADALRPTAWLQSDHPRLRAMAAPVARLEVSDARKMNMLLERARPYLAEIDFRGHHTALDTLSRRAGDCTEAAVLLAALGRAAGIPTRVASGLVYSRARYHGVSNVFMPHSWTLAWVDGEWRSFDLALDSFDSTHIALVIGDGDARSIAAAAQLASLLRWEGIAEVRVGPG